MLGHPVVIFFCGVTTLAAVLAILAVIVYGKEKVDGASNGAGYILTVVAFVVLALKAAFTAFAILKQKGFGVEGYSAF
jgi:hypothetical protein